MVMKDGINFSSEKEEVRSLEVLVAEKALHNEIASNERMFYEIVEGTVVPMFQQLARHVDGWMVHQGFGGNDKGMEIALMHTELSELLEGIRKGDWLNEAEECADLLIRLLHYCGKYEIDLGRAMIEKMHTNLARPYKHGKAF